MKLTQILFYSDPMKKFQLILFTAGVLPYTALAQVQLERMVIANGGSFLTGPGISLSVTLGEPVTTTAVAASAILTQGFQQPDLISVGISENTTGYSLEAYPNPVSDLLHIEITSDKDMHLLLSVYDLAGRKVLPDISHYVTTDIGSRVTINMQSLYAAVYLLKIHNKDHLSILKTIRIVKPY
jgi:Secretion system C-terminal sorting domain